MLARIRYRILLVVGVATMLGLVATISFYSRYQERTLLSQHESTMRKLTEAIAEGLHSVMLAGSADIAQAFAERLKTVPDITEFRIVRIDGTEAFQDNTTINEVNTRRGEELFPPRDTESRVQVIPKDDVNLRRTIDTVKPIVIYQDDAAGNPQLSFLAPLANQNQCHRCHGKADPVRGVMRLTTSLASVERDILNARQQSFVIFAMALIATVLLTGYMLGRVVVRPIEKVTSAMARVSEGDLDHKLAERSNDELGRMGASFNQMTDQLQSTYRRLRREQNKITTVIETATEGIVVTDATGAIVLVNPAATLLLAKSLDDLVAKGYELVVDDSDFIAHCLQTGNPQAIRYKQHELQVIATEIRGSDKGMIGTVILIRDVTEEKRLEEDLRRTSTTDALTGLFNRRFLDATLTAEFVRSERSLLPLSVLMMDIDHFKKFNDTHGHDQGDRVLQMVARCLREQVRSFDFPCRYGGEEYVAILPGMDSDAAYLVAEAIRIKVAETEIDSLHVQLSIGVATFPNVKASTPEALIEAADAALYRAKETGRNRVVVAVEAA